MQAVEEEEGDVGRDESAYYFKLINDGVHWHEALRLVRIADLRGTSLPELREKSFECHEIVELLPECIVKSLADKRNIRYDEDCCNHDGWIDYTLPSLRGDVAGAYSLEELYTVLYDVVRNDDDEEEEEEEEGDDVVTSSIHEGSDIPPVDIHNDEGGHLALREDVVFESNDYDYEVGSISSSNIEEYHPPNHIPSHNKNYEVSKQNPSCIIKSLPPPNFEAVRQKASRDSNVSPTNIIETPLGTSATENHDTSIVLVDYGIVGLIRYIDEEDELSTPPLQPLPPILQVDLDKKLQHYENEEGVMCISAPTISLSKDKRMHPTAVPIIRRYSLMALDIAKKYGHYLNVCSCTYIQHSFPKNYEKNSLKRSTGVYAVYILVIVDGVEKWVLDKIGCALKLLGRIAHYPCSTKYKIELLIDVDSIPLNVERLLHQNTIEMLEELACPLNGVYEPLRVFFKELLNSVAINAGLGKSIMVQSLENGTAYDLKLSDPEHASRVKVLGEFASYDADLRDELHSFVHTAHDSFKNLPELERFYREGPIRGIYSRALLNWASGKRDDQHSAHVMFTKAAGIEHVVDALPPLNPNAGGGNGLRYDHNYTKAQLMGVGWEKYRTELKDMLRLAIDGKLVHCFFNYWKKYGSWAQFVKMITTIHLEVESTSSLDVGFAMIAHVFNNPSANHPNQLPSELVYFVLNLPSGGSALACVNKSWCTAGDATNKTNDSQALLCGAAISFVCKSLNEMLDRTTTTEMAAIDAVIEKIMVERNLHMGKIQSAAWARHRVMVGVDAFLTCGTQRSEYWTRLARNQTKGKYLYKDSSLNGRSTEVIAWYGMIAFTQGSTFHECAGYLAAYCAKFSNPRLCWAKVLEYLYSCAWYPILSTIARFVYGENKLKLPSDEIQQSRLAKRKAGHDERLRVEREKMKKKENKEKKVQLARKTVQQVPRDKDERQTWLTNRKEEWRAQRKRRSSLAGQDKVVEIETHPSRKRKRPRSVASKVSNVFVVPHDKVSFHEWLATRKVGWNKQRKRCIPTSALDQENDVQPRLKRARVIKADTAEANEVHRSAIISVMNGRPMHMSTRVFKSQVKQTLGENWKEYSYNKVRAKMIEDGELEFTWMGYKLKSTKETAVKATSTATSTGEMAPPWETKLVERRKKRNADERIAAAAERARSLVVDGIKCKSSREVLCSTAMIERDGRSAAMVAHFSNEREKKELLLAQKKEHHSMEMWKDANNKLKGLRNDLKNEVDEEVRAELMLDIEGTKKRKEELAKLLGM